MIDPEVIPVGSRRGVRWLVIFGPRAAVFSTEDEARDFAQLVIARGVSDYRTRCPRCHGYGWVR